MNPGDLRNKILIQRKRSLSPLEDEDYEDIMQVWAKIINLHGKEYLEAEKLRPKASKKITIRYKEELDSSINPRVSIDYRIKYKENFYNIIYSDNIQERSKYIEFMVESE